MKKPETGRLDPPERPFLKTADTADFTRQIGVTPEGKLTAWWKATPNLWETSGDESSPKQSGMWARVKRVGRTVAKTLIVGTVMLVRVLAAPIVLALTAAGALALVLVVLAFAVPLAVLSLVIKMLFR